MRTRPRSLASLLLAIAAALSVAPSLVVAQTAQDPSDVVLVFDMSNSILLSDDGTNTEFAAVLNGIADRVEESADELVIGNAEISFVVFGRQAASYPAGCERLALNQNPAAVEQLESCLRAVAAEYDAGADAPVRQELNTADTDHVRALRTAANLLPEDTTRSAVIFFTDGAHDPPGVDRDDENVVNQVAAAFEGQSPLAILPVGLGARAGEFEDELQAIYDAYLRDMEPCEGRAAFSWPQVVFQSADDAGVAVAEALQEVTCSFVFVPPPSGAPPTPSPSPTATPAAPEGPVSVQLLAGNESITVQWQPPTAGAEDVTEYVVRCTGTGGEPSEVTVAAPATEAVVEGLAPGQEYGCAVAAIGPGGEGPATESAERVIVLGVPLTPGQPRVEAQDGAARVHVDPVAGSAPVETYIAECAGASGVVGTGADPQPNVLVTGLANGATLTCVVYAENRIGRSAASVASAAFSPCAGLDCNPLLYFGILGGAIAAALLVAFYAWRRYAMRNRVWITAQVDGGANRPLGWGPELGIRLDRDDDGWYAAPRAGQGSRIQVRYIGRQRFDVVVAGRTYDVHQGDPTTIRDDDGGIHQLILRKYRGKPSEPRTESVSPVVQKESAEIGDRLEGRDEPAAPPAADQGDGWVR